MTKEDVILFLKNASPEDTLDILDEVYGLDQDYENQYMVYTGIYSVEEEETRSEDHNDFEEQFEEEDEEETKY